MSFVRVADVGEIPEGHVALFEASGRAVAVFNVGSGRFYETGRCRVDDSLAIGVYDVRVRDGGVEVDLP